jgi:hypothetical protein
MTQGWIKLYYRDENKVMRAVEGVKILPNEMISLDKSVYTLESERGNKYWLAENHTVMRVKE